MDSITGIVQSTIGLTGCVGGLVFPVASLYNRAPLNQTVAQENHLSRLEAASQQEQPLTNPRSYFCTVRQLSQGMHIGYYNPPEKTNCSGQRNIRLRQSPLSNNFLSKSI